MLLKLTKTSFRFCIIIMISFNSNYKNEDKNYCCKLQMYCKKYIFKVNMQLKLSCIFLPYCDMDSLTLMRKKMLGRTWFHFLDLMDPGRWALLTK